MDNWRIGRLASWLNPLQVLFHFAVEDIMDELAGGLRFTENELAVIAGKPGCEAGHHGDRGHFAAVCTGVKHFPGGALNKQIGAGTGCFGTFKFTGKAITLGGKAICDFVAGHLPFNHDDIFQAVGNAGGQDDLGRIIAKIELLPFDWAAHLLNALSERRGFVLTGINQDSKSFKGGFNKDWFDNITP